MKKVLLILAVLLSLGIFYACSSDGELNPYAFESGDNKDSKEEENSGSCVTGTIYRIGSEESGEQGYVYINEIKMPKESDELSYIKIVVVPKDEFPFQDYQEGDVIDFKILEVISEFPLIRDAMHTYPNPYPEYLCTIELCK